MYKTITRDKLSAISIWRLETRDIFTGKMGAVYLTFIALTLSAIIIQLDIVHGLALQATKNSELRFPVDIRTLSRISELNKRNDIHSRMDIFPEVRNVRDYESILREEALRDEVLRDEVLRDEVLRDEVLRDEVMRDEMLRDEVLRDEVLRDEVLRDEMLKDEVLRDEVLRDEVLKNAVIKNALLKDEVLRDEVLRDEVLRDEVLKNAVVRDALLKDEVLRDEVLRGDLTELRDLKNAIHDERSIVDGGMHKPDNLGLIRNARKRESITRSSEINELKRIQEDLRNQVKRSEILREEAKRQASLFRSNPEIRESVLREELEALRQQLKEETVAIEIAQKLLNAYHEKAGRANEALKNEFLKEAAHQDNIRQIAELKRKAVIRDMGLVKKQLENTSV